MKLDLRSEYEQGERVVWWSFSSCTKAVAVLENEQFFGKSGTRALFAIESHTGKNIRQHSFYPHEDEILLLPGREFQVMGSLDMTTQLTIIQLKEVQPRYPTIASLPASTSPVKVSYSSKELTDNDILHVIKEALQQKQCTILNLSYHRITHEGAALLSKALKQNEVSLCVETIWTSLWNQPLIQLIGERKQNWQRKRTIKFDCLISEHINLKQVHRSNVDLSFRAHRFFLLNENAPYHNILLFSLNNFSSSFSSDINPRHSLSEDKFCLISSSRRIFSFSNRKSSLHSHVEHSILKADQTSDLFSHRMKKKIFA